MLRLSIVTVNVAPYRLGYYRSVAAALGAEGAVAVHAGEVAPKDHPWKDLGQEAEPYRLRTLGLEQGLWGACAALWRQLEEHRPDVVWVHEHSLLCFAALLWAKGRGIPVALSTDLGDHPSPHATTRLKHWWHCGFSTQVDGVIANTPEASRSFRNAFLPVLLAPHAADAEVFVPGAAPAGAVRFLFVGRLERAKGVDTLRRAGDLLEKRGFAGAFEVCLVGTGEEEKALRREAETRPWLRLAGFQEGRALVAAYQAAHVFVLPTKWDTYGVVFHEAACCGLPVLAGRQAGAVETLVFEGETGWALDAEDAEGWADKMELFLRDEHLGPQMGRRARAVAEEWGVKRLGADTLAWLQRLVRR